MGNRKSKNSTIIAKELDEDELKNICNRTRMSPEEVRKWHSEFMRDCPTGKLDKKLFTSIYKQLFPFGDATKFCNICFMAYDKDKSGYIDFYEFIWAIGIISKGNMEDKLKLAFDIYDYNDDGFIEKKEAEKIVQSLFQMYGENVSESNAKQLVNKIMKKFDQDNNGLLSEQEFIDGCMKDEEMRSFFAPLCK